MSGDPQATCFRIIANDATRDMCIQFFFYWAYQHCMMASHTYDYEAIFIYLNGDDPYPQLIVNGGLGRPECGFHKNEIRPRAGERTGHELHFSEKTALRIFSIKGPELVETTEERFPLEKEIQKLAEANQKVVNPLREKLTLYLLKHNQINGDILTKLLTIKMQDSLNS